MGDNIDPEATGYGGTDPYAALPKGTTGRPQVTINAQPMRVKADDGTIHNFPANAPHDQVEKIMNDYNESRRDKSTTLGEIGVGAMDPVEGGGELLSDLLPKQVNRAMIAANNKMADYSMGLIRKLPTEEEGGKPAQMRQREAAIQANRGSNTSTDYARMAGDILSPVNWLGVGLGKLVAPAETAIREAGPVVGRIVSGMEQGEIAGLTSAATQPTTSDDRGQEKAMQMGEGAVAGGVLGGGFAAAGRLTQYITNLVGPEAMKDREIQELVKTFEADEKGGHGSVGDLLKVVSKATKGKPVTLADIGGENVQGLAGQVGRKPGPGRQFARGFLKKRDEGAAKRLSSIISKTVSGGPSLFRTKKLLTELRRGAARPAYDNVYALQGVWSPRLQEFLSEPEVQEGLNRGWKQERLIATTEGRPITASQLGVDLDSEGNIEMKGAPNMRLLDMAKRGLDAMILEDRQRIGGNGKLSQNGNILNNFRNAFVNEIDNLDTKGIYKKARAEYAGLSAAMDAAELGKHVFDFSPEETADIVGKMSKSDREFYQIGVADHLLTRLSDTTLNGDETKKLLNSDTMRKQLRPAFDSTLRFNKFVDGIMSERQMFESKQKYMGGSQTADRRIQEVGLMDRPETGIFKKLINRDLFGAAASAFSLLHDIDIKNNPELNDKIARILFATKLPSQVEQMLLAGSKGRPAAPPSRAAETMQQLGIGMTPAATVDLTKERSPQ